MKTKQTIIAIALALTAMISCKKLIKVEPPSQILTTAEVYANKVTAESVLANCYYQMANYSNVVFSGYGSLGLGASADELIPYNPNDRTLRELYTNEFTGGNDFIKNGLWGTAYMRIYAANSIIENVPSTGYSDSVKYEMMGQAHFLRAFCNFYLVNLFGDIPLVTTTNWRNTNLLARSPQQEVYKLILDDLEYAQKHLQANYNAGKGERIVPNRFAAEALLARVHLYLKNWKEAEVYANVLIEQSNTFSLVALNDIVAPNNKEAIWQLKQFSGGQFYSPEGNLFVPRVRNSNIPPQAYFPVAFLNGFEEADQRKLAWIDSTKITTGGQVYYYPYKYKTNQGNVLTAYREYQTVFRLAEMYLIRAEARLETGQLELAVMDLNQIRQRAGLLVLPENLTAREIKTTLIKERRFELMAEMGHRWLDLKRWGIASVVLKPIKTDWQDTDQLYPIPVTELITDPNLTQNPGYDF